MNAYRLAVIAFASACATSAPALEPEPAATQVQLVCPDRSPRMADISLAMAAARYPATEAQRNRMLERARSVCAAGLSVVSLIPPEDLRFAEDGALVSDARH